MVVKLPTKLKQFKCTKCGEIYMSEVTESENSVILSYLSSQKMESEKNGICNNCEDVSVRNFLKRGKNVHY